MHNLSMDGYIYPKLLLLLFQVSKNTYEILDCKILSSISLSLIFNQRSLFRLMHLSPNTIHLTEASKIDHRYNKLELQAIREWCTMKASVFSQFKSLNSRRR